MDAEPFLIHFISQSCRGTRFLPTVWLLSWSLSLFIYMYISVKFKEGVMLRLRNCNLNCIQILPG